ncbi:BON domain-containing protein [Paraliomyxa miuraensis]|uniref:BON domain-containing protein n=1 Tax=Paraliomyxa miuraensis TaxID=376150 RepID=UPI00225BA20C|nr:BON domain-containing protein [Paraliomyxa miuraensis]MCX4240298.1 BON domain-containing protein [Paraliomyxa miuraensis]
MSKAPQEQSSTPEPVAAGKTAESAPRDDEAHARDAEKEKTMPEREPRPSAIDECPGVVGRGLVTAIERELRDDAVVPDDVTVTNRYGVVTLSGKVPSVLAEQRALRLAETVRGVKVVMDDLELEAREPGKTVDDPTLLQDVKQALLQDPTADSWKIDIDVKDGRVTLRGAVDSWVEAQHAEWVAMSVRGVRSVDSQLTVKPPAPRVDSEVLQDVQARLRWDALVDDSLIDVFVDDGEVRLVGTVGSAAERRRARGDGWVTGVVDVDASDLQIEPCLEAVHRDPARSGPTGEEITRAIVLAMALEPTVASHRVEPQVIGGLVTLTGTVDNANARATAERIAAHTVGVSKVDNRIEVRPSKPVDDQVLATRIDQALLRNPVTEAYEIDVTVNGGHAVLSGQVDDYAEFGEATYVASGIEGVVAVDNRLSVVDPEAFVYDPYVVPFHPYLWPGRWHGTLATTLADERIADEIRDELFWSPFVDRDEIQVTVENGKAILRGKVDSWAERDAAIENAYEGGAVSVDDQLVVEQSEQ